MADAGGRLMYAYKDLLELAGLVTRLYTLTSTLHDLPKALEGEASSDDSIEVGNVDVIIPGVGDAPPLVKDLSLIVRQGEHLMITGANGVASWIKSHVFPEFIKAGRTFEELEYILEKVFLKYLPDREGDRFTRKEWRDVLSGGEKQRMSLARVFYHRPRYAILDECTSAVSSDVEGRMYGALKATGMTLTTVSLRHSLSKYHTQLLTLTAGSDGSTQWTLSKVGTAEERTETDREIKSLEDRLPGVQSGV